MDPVPAAARIFIRGPSGRTPGFAQPSGSFCGRYRAPVVKVETRRATRITLAVVSGRDGLAMLSNRACPRSGLPEKWENPVLSNALTAFFAEILADVDWSGASTGRPLLRRLEQLDVIPFVASKQEGKTPGEFSRRGGRPDRKCASTSQGFCVNGGRNRFHGFAGSSAASASLNLAVRFEKNKAFAFLPCVNGNRSSARGERACRKNTRGGLLAGCAACGAAKEGEPVLGSPRIGNGRRRAAPSLFKTKNSDKSLAKIKTKIIAWPVSHLVGFLEHPRRISGTDGVPKSYCSAPGRAATKNRLQVTDDSGRGCSLGAVLHLRQGKALSNPDICFPVAGFLSRPALMRDHNSDNSRQKKVKKKSKNKQKSKARNGSARFQQLRPSRICRKRVHVLSMPSAWGRVGARARCLLERGTEGKSWEAALSSPPSPLFKLGAEMLSFCKDGQGNPWIYFSFFSICFKGCSCSGDWWTSEKITHAGGPPPMADRRQADKRQAFPRARSPLPTTV